MARIDESREMDSASRRALSKLNKQTNTNTAAYAPFARNLLHNGQMQVNQRGGATVAGYGGTFIADRWQYVNNAIGTQSLNYQTKAAFGVAVPAGRPQPANYLYSQIQAIDAAPAAGDYTVCVQNLEGQFVQHLGYGTAAAQSVTLTFDVFCTVSGTFIVELTNSGRTIGRSYTTDAGRFKTVSVTFPGDTVQAIPFTNAAAFAAQWFLAAGSTYTGGAALGTSWNAVSNTRAVGITNNFPLTINNAWGVTNVQLEVGTVATPYEVRTMADDLFICQRYYRIPAAWDFFGSQMSTTSAMMMTYFHPPMRAAPTMAQLPGTLTCEIPFVAFQNLTALGSTASSINSARVVINWAAASGAMGYPVHSSNAWVSLSAEI